MSDKEKPEQGSQNAAQDGQQFQLQKIYSKDISLETPNSPDIFTEKWEPEVNIELQSSGKHISGDVHEVVLTVTVTAKIGEKTAYLVEIQQAGIFTIAGFGDDERAHMLGSFCPNILFPYAREAISDVVAKGGFPQLLLAPVNFDALYAQHVQKQQNEQDSSTEEAVH